MQCCNLQKNIDLGIFGKRVTYQNILLTPLGLLESMSEIIGKAGSQLPDEMENHISLRF